MPIETATYIKQLNPDWPTPSDFVKDGDDHLRLVKQVTLNSLPNVDSPVTGTPTALNNVTDSMTWLVAETNPVTPAYWAINDPEQIRAGTATPALIAVATATVSQFNQNPSLTLTWAALQNILYPVGGEFRSYTDNRNPADILGFGTWSAVVGLIAGVGSATDGSGMAGGYSPGYQAGWWRVQHSQIVAQTVGLAMDPVADHEHDFDMYGNHTDGTGYVQASNGGGGQGTKYTTPAGGHTPSGSVTIGAGDTVSGAPFYNPYYGCYIWTRTA